MILDETPAKLAEFLLQIKAVVLRPDNPFKWASGWNSPIYCDNRKTLSYPRIRTFVRQAFVRTINENFGKPDVIAGVATGGIAHGVLVAQELGLPFVYVRSEPKGHGMTNLIEGYLEKGQTVLVIEDLISTGNSSLKAVKALKEFGCTVKGLVAIFSYGFPVADQSFREARCPYYTLTDYDTLIKQALKTHYIQESDLETLELWRTNPSEWQK